MQSITACPSPLPVSPLPLSNRPVPSAADPGAGIAPPVVHTRVDMQPGRETPQQALFRAAREGDATAVKKLLAGGKVDARQADPIDGLGLDALMLAARAGHEDVVLILSRGAAAESHRENAAGDSALTLASAAGHAAVVEVLLAKKPGQAHMDRALVAAVKGGHAEAARILVQGGAAVEAADADGSAPLHHAARLGHASVIDLLVEKRAKLGKADKAGNTALQLAVRNLKIPAVRRLLHAGAAADLRAGGTSVMQAAAAGQAEALVLLLAAGDDAHAAMPSGDTALMLAAGKGHEEALRLLAKKGDVNHANRDGDTALILAARSGHVGIVQRLLVKSARVGHVNLKRESALYAAVRGGHDRVALKLLAELSPDLVNDALRLLPKGSDLKKDEHGWPALNRAAQRGQLPLVHLLLAKGANVDEGAAQDESALSATAASGHPSVIELLLAKGADVNRQDKVWGLSALMHGSASGQLESVQMLLANCASVNLSDQRGWTALDYAIGNQHTACADFLRSKAGKANKH